MNIIDIKLEELKPYENNPKNNEEVVESNKVICIVTDFLTNDQVNIFKYNVLKYYKYY